MEVSNKMVLKRGTVALIIRDSDGEIYNARLEDTLYIPSYPQNIFSVRAATIHAVLTSVIQMSFVMYLSHQFERLTTTPSAPTTPMIIICCAHLISKVARTLKIKRGPTRRRLLQCFVLLQLEESLNEARSIWRDIVTVFSGDNDIDRMFSVRRLQKRVTRIPTNEINFDDAEMEGDDISTGLGNDFTTTMSIKEQSPFSVHFETEVLINREHDHYQEDDYHAPEAVSQMLRLQCGFLSFPYGAIVFSSRPESKVASPILQWNRISEQ